MKKLILLLWYIVGLYLLYGNILVNALSSDSVTSPTESLPKFDTGPDLAIASIIQYMILLTGVLAVMMITWGGISMILATGDDEKIKKSKKTIIYAFVGLVVTGLAYSIVELITRAQLN